MYGEYKEQARQNGELYLKWGEFQREVMAKMKVKTVDSYLAGYVEKVEQEKREDVAVNWIAAHVVADDDGRVSFADLFRLFKEQTGADVSAKRFGLVLRAQGFGSRSVRIDGRVMICRVRVVA